jgi:hypothetical protein
MRTIEFTGGGDGSFVLYVTGAPASRPSGAWTGHPPGWLVERGELAGYGVREAVRFLLSGIDSASAMTAQLVPAEEIH